VWFETKSILHLSEFLKC